MAICLTRSSLTPTLWTAFAFRYVSNNSIASLWRTTSWFSDSSVKIRLLKSSGRAIVNANERIDSDHKKLTNGETKLELIYCSLLLQILHEREEGLLVL